MSGPSRTKQFAHQDDVTSGGNLGDSSNEDDIDYVNVFVNPDVPPERPAPPPVYASVHPKSGGGGGQGGHPGTPAYSSVSPKAGQGGGVDAREGFPLYASISNKGGGSLGGDSGTCASTPTYFPSTPRKPVFVPPKPPGTAGGWATGSGPGASPTPTPTSTSASAANPCPTPPPNSAASANPGASAVPLTQPSNEEVRGRKGGAGPTPEGKTPRHACLLPKPGTRAIARAAESEVVIVESEVIPPPPASPARRPAQQQKPEVTSVPNTNIGVAIMVLLCFNLPLGLAAVFCSLSATRAYRDGHSKRGHKRARISIILSLIGIVVTVLIVMSVVLHMALSKQAQSRSALPPRRGQGF